MMALEFICLSIDKRMQEERGAMGNNLNQRGCQLGPQANPRGSIWDVLVIIFLSMAVVPTSVAILLDWLCEAGIVAIPTDSLRHIKMISLVSAQEAALFILTLGSMASTGWRLGDLRLFSRRWWWDVSWGMGFGFCFVGINWVGEYVSRLLFSLFMEESRVLAILSRENSVANQLMSREQAPWVRISMAILVIFVAPIVEEAFFRGYAYNIFKARLGTAQALFISSLLFAGVHMYLIHFLPVFLLGFLLALLYEWRQTLLTPIMAHGVMNLLVAMALHYF